MMAKQKEMLFWVPPTFDSDGVQVTSGIGGDGKEYPDPVPNSPLTGLQQSEDILKTIDRMIRSQALRELAEQEGFDSPEEALDLDLDGEEPWPESGYEEHYWPAVKAPEVPPAPPVVSQKASEGLVSEVSAKKMAEKPKSEVSRKSADVVDD